MFRVFVVYDNGQCSPQTGCRTKYIRIILSKDSLDSSVISLDEVVLDEEAGEDFEDEATEDDKGENPWERRKEEKKVTS